MQKKSDFAICVLVITRDYIMEGILDIQFMNNLEEIITQEKHVCFFLN